MRGASHWYVASNNDLAQATIWFRKAIEHDPALASAKAWLAIALVHSVQVGIARSTRELWLEALDLAQQSVRLDPRSSLAFLAFALVNALAGNYEAALEAGKHAFELNVYDANARGVLGMCHFTAGEHAQALEMFSAAMQLSRRPRADLRSGNDVNRPAFSQQ